MKAFCKLKGLVVYWFDMILNALVYCLNKALWCKSEVVYIEEAPSWTSVDIDKYLVALVMMDTAGAYWGKYVEQLLWLRDIWSLNSKNLWELFLEGPSWAKQLFADRNHC